MAAATANRMPCFVPVILVIVVGHAEQLAQAMFAGTARKLPTKKRLLAKSLNNRH